MGCLNFLFLMIVGSLTACSAPDVIEKERVLFDKQVANNTTITKQHLQVGEHQLFYASAGDPLKPALIIIHGTPGNWKQYARYMLNQRLLNDFYVLVIDRPGWGESVLAGRRQTASFEEQAAIIAGLITKLKAESNNQPVLLMGHSLGASIAPRVAMDYPQLVDGLLLLAGTLTADLASPRWFNYVASIPGVSWLIGDVMAKANKEIFELKQNLLVMEPLWSDLSAHTLVVQGMKDQLVYPANVDFAEKILNPSVGEVLRLQSDGHLFPMSRRDDVVNWSQCVLNKIQSQGIMCEGGLVSIE